MKNQTFKKIGLLGLISLFVFLCVPYNLDAQFDEGEILPSQEERINVGSGEGKPLTEKTLTTGEEKEAQKPQYAPGEVLVKFKEGVNPEDVLKRLNFETKGIERVHSIAPVVANFKKDYKLEKDSDGWYWFLGKQYKEAGQIPDEEAFKEAYKQMSPEEKSLYRSYKIILPEGLGVDEAVAALKNSPDVEFAQPNYIMEPYMVPNDPYYASSKTWGQTYDDLWGLKKINSQAAWDITQGETAVVAVIDTGVDYNHEDLKDNIYRDVNGNIIGYDFGNNDSDPMDADGHGTHCAGTIAAVGNNTKGVIGVAPRAKIMPVKIFPNAYSDVCARAIKYAADNGAKVLSNSWGPSSRTPSHPTIEGAIDYAYAKNEDEIPGNGIDDDKDGFIDNMRGCVVVFAAGNSNDDVSYYSPANYTKVISVAAATQKDEKCSFSNYGVGIDVAAPGGGYSNELGKGGTDIYNILSTMPDTSNIAKQYPNLKISNGYWRLAGTSMACPHVAGLAALILAKHPEFSNEQVRQVLRASADDVQTSGWDINSGYGRINAYKALQVSSACVARIQSVSLDANNNRLIVNGNASGVAFGSYALQLINYDTGQALSSQNYYAQIVDEKLGEISLNNILDGRYIIKLEVKDSANNVFSDRILYNIDNLVVTAPRDYAVLTPSTTISIAGSSKYNYTIVWGKGTNPISWSNNGVTIGGGAGILGSIDGSALPQEDTVVVIKVEDAIGNMATIKASFVLGIKAGWPKELDSSSGLVRPWYNAEDLNKDGITEIITLTEHGKLAIFRPDGTIIAQLVVANLPNFTRPIITDLDADGGKEIVIFKGAYGQVSSAIYVYSLNATTLSMDWSVTVNEIGLITGGCIVEDINGDGKKEIIISGVGNGLGSTKCSWYTMVYNAQGQKLTGWPQKLIPEEYDNYTTGVSPGTIIPVSSVGNLDDDAKPEIISLGVSMSGLSASGFNEASNTTSLYISCFNDDGSLVYGWPKMVNQVSEAYSSNLCFASAVIGDINGDGKNEIIVGTLNGLYVLDRVGNTLWSAQAPSGGKNFISEIILSDIDKDKVPEVIFSLYPNFNGESQTTYVYKGNGALISYHPAGSWYLCGSVAADVNKDGNLDIVTLRRIEKTVDGQNLPYIRFEFWSPQTGNTFYAFELIKNSPIYSPAICDLENDGKTELIATYCYWNSGAISMAVWELNNFPLGPLNSDWPMFRRDPQLTGWYRKTPVITGISSNQAMIGESVTITGSNFGTTQGIGYVEFYNGVKAEVSSWADTKIVCTVPADAQSGAIFIATDNGISNALSFTLGEKNPPTVVISSPAAGAKVSSAGFDFKGTATDASGIKEVRVSVYDNYQKIYTVDNQLASYIASNNTWTFKVLSSQMTAGSSLTLSVRAQDKQDNWSEPQSISVMVNDSTPPTVKVNSPTPGAKVMFSGFNFTGTADDTVGVANVYISIYDYGKAALTVNNKTANYSPSTKEWIFPVLSSYLTIGKNAELRVRANDTSNNYSALTVIVVSVVTDTTPPTTPIVSDGGIFTKQADRLYAAWASADPESGIAEYQYRITQGSTTGLVVKDWASVGTSSSVTAGGLSLTDANTYYFAVKAKNAAGLWSPIGYSDGITVDAASPVTSDSGIDGQWHNSPVTVTLAATDDGSGVDKTYYSTDGSNPTIVYTGPFTLSKEGVYTIKYYSKDKAGNSEQVKTAANQVKIDKTGPTGTITINKNATYTNSTSVTLSLSATDSGSGVSQMKFCNTNSNNDFDWSTPESYAATKSWTLPTGDGQKTVYVKFKDLAGNWSEAVSDTITLDTIPPKVVITSPKDGLLTNKTPITLEGTVDGRPFSESRDLKEGENTLTKEAKDAAGNIGSASIKVTLDTIPPDTTITSGPSGIINSTSATFTFTSNEPGCMYSWQLDNGAWSSWSTNTSAIYNNLTQGPHTFKVKAKDKAGNVDLIPAVREWTIKLNQLPVVTYCSVSPTVAIQRQMVYFRGDGSDPDGKIIGYNWRSSINGQLSTSKYFSSNKLSVGTRTIYFKVKDNNGAWSKEVTRTLTIKPRPIRHPRKSTKGRTGVALSGRG